MAGTSRAFINQIENGKANPTVTKLLAITNALDVELWEVLR